MKSVLTKTTVVAAICWLMATAAMAQDAAANLPKEVDWRKARVTDVGVAVLDVKMQVKENAVTHKNDTTLIDDSRIEWLSEGAQITPGEAGENSKNGPRKVTPKVNSGSLQSTIFNDFYYNVFKFEYPSIDADGNEVMLSAIAACPTAGGTSQVENVVLGTHITITADRERPSNQDRGFAKEDWGMLMSLAAGNKVSYKSWTIIVKYLAEQLLVPPMFIYSLIRDIVMAFTDPSGCYNLVVLPDYEGYGLTADRAHPYLYQELTARQSVDALRYGIALYKKDPGLNAIRHPFRDGWRTMTCGYSQGGSVAMACHRFIEQNHLVSELHFSGSICGDGPYDAMATLMYYVQREKSGQLMSMPVVLPLIVKGMLDTNPYMKNHKPEDYFTEKFLSTGIMDILKQKQLNTDEIGMKFAQLYDEGKDGDPNYYRDLFTKVKVKVTLNGKEQEVEVGRARLSNIMNNQCYNYFSSLYDANQNTYTSAAGIPLPAHRGVIEDLHFALASNDMTRGWSPCHAIFLFHSNADTVVPFDNAQSAKNRLGGYVVLHESDLGHDHVPAGTDFFAQDSEIDIVMKDELRIYEAIHTLSELPWDNQQTSSLPSSW